MLQYPHLVLVAVEVVLEYTHVILGFLLRHVQHLSAVGVVDVVLARVSCDFLYEPFLV